MPSVSTAFVSVGAASSAIPNRNSTKCVRVESGGNSVFCRRRSLLRATTLPSSPTGDNPEAEPESDVANRNRLVRFAAFAALCVYLPSILHPDMPAETSEAVRDAFKLSVNFAFVTPIFLPQLAPVYSPVYEGVFNFVIFWFTLFLGFASEDVSAEREGVPFAPFGIGGLFLTNMFYLPYLFLRKSNPHRVTPQPKSHNFNNILLQYGEGKALPLKMAALGVFSIAWAFVGRPDMLPINIGERLASVPDLLSHSVLCKAMFIDTIPLSLFQSALVNDDVKRRNWVGPQKDTAVAAARFVPFFGLCFYLWQRASCASLVESDAKQ